MEDYEFNMGVQFDPQNVEELIELIRSVAREVKYNRSRGVIQSNSIIYSIADKSKIIGSWAAMPKEPDND